jgi:hypothetical protein
VAKRPIPSAESANHSVASSVTPRHAAFPPLIHGLNPHGSHADGRWVATDPAGKAKSRNARRNLIYCRKGISSFHSREQRRANSMNCHVTESKVLFQD